MLFPYGDTYGGDLHMENEPPAGFVRIMRCDARTMARWQSFPDSYKFPETIGLAQLIIGNSVPPLVMQKTAEMFLQPAPAYEVV